MSAKTPGPVIANAHNLAAGRPPPGLRRFGLRVSLPPGDTFQQLLGQDWVTEHWFATAMERDQALADMAARHPYSRVGDQPSIRLEAIDR